MVGSPLGLTRRSTAAALVVTVSVAHHADEGDAEAAAGAKGAVVQAGVPRAGPLVGQQGVAAIEEGEGGGASQGPTCEEAIPAGGVPGVPVGVALPTALAGVAVGGVQAEAAAHPWLGRVAGRVVSPGQPAAAHP